MAWNLVKTRENFTFTLLLVPKAVYFMYEMTDLIKV